MPTVLRVGAYRLYFVSHDLGEPPHVHVDKENKTAKFWLDPIQLTRSIGYSPYELGKIQRIVNKNKQKLLEAWHGYFGN